MTMATYLIVGNGVAGNTAAETIRKHDAAGKILIFAKEKYPFYYIPGLPEYLSGERPRHRLIIHDEQWYGDNRLELHLETAINRIDAARKLAFASDGKTYSYDKLLLATGGISFVPPIKGAGLPGVFTLRTIGDADAIREKAAKSQRLALIGGGILGLEAGNGLRKLGLEVTVIEFFPRLLPRQMDVPGAAILQQQMEDMGFRFHLGATTREIVRQNDGLLIRLESGEAIEADMILISAGTRPDLTLAKSLGLEIDKGVKVDDTMQTGLADIYAGGDLIEHRGRYYGLWSAAMEQGRVAGAAMAGRPASYEGTVPSNILKVVGIDLLAAGEIDVEGRLESLVSKDEAQKIYRKLVLQDNVIIGAILLGDLGGSAGILTAIKKKTDITSCKADLAAGTLDFAKLI
ncbi:MAG: FAD-dependent oxidoreductase [Thermodesulfobacteriota bacterium]